ncbi:unnamed protein product [Cuscuta campestris]|uniref:Reverse transcriptase domain-containing protein n=1 Tax=Cuscuta campestris TaxID=132261 RepID=A0A484LAG8_9ASTE|nr:unnamed protein product [Cuscuta campestris]
MMKTSVPHLGDHMLQTVMVTPSIDEPEGLWSPFICFDAREEDRIVIRSSFAQMFSIDIFKIIHREIDSALNMADPDSGWVGSVKTAVGLKGLPLFWKYPFRNPTRSKLFSELFKSVDTDDKPSDKSSFKGCPLVSFSKEEVEALSNRFKFALIGRFRRRPPIAVVKNFLIRLGLIGGFTVGELNSNSILINFEQDEDYQRFFLRKSWTLGKDIMVVTKWSPNLRPDEDSPIVPVWVTIPNLPIHLHDQKALFCITSKLGKPLKVDNATLNFSRPKAARVCIEIDVSKNRHQKIHVKHIDDDLFFQVLYEDPPSFCDSCQRLGHNATICKGASQPEIPVGNQPPAGTVQPRKDKGKLIENEWINVQRKRRHVTPQPAFRSVTRQHKSNGEWVPKPTFTQDPLPGKTLAFKLGFNGFLSVANNKIWFLWDTSRFSLIDVIDAGQISHFSLRDIHKSFTFTISGIYGDHTTKDRKLLWSNIESFHANVNHPWCLGGDFNTISDFLHHKGSRLPELEAITDFSDCIRDNKLLECNYTGSAYTWHGVRSNGNVWRRLDRVFYNTFWADHWNIISMQHLAKGGSDHCPILFLSKPDARNTTKSFRFQNMWLLRDDFRQICKDSWEEIPFHGEMHSLFKRLHHLKEKLSSWNKTHFGNIFDMIKEAESDATKAEQLFEADPSTDNKILYNQKLAELQEAHRREYAFWKQKCNLKWLKDGDANTKFFHSLVKERRRKQQITSLFNDQGQLIDKPDDLEALAVTHFTTLLNSSEPCSSSEVYSQFLSTIPHLINHTQNECLISLPTEEEIKVTVWDMDPNSSPGPDGFNINFFKQCWDIIKDDLTSACQEVFLGIPLPKAASSSNICLLPKTDNAMRLNDFRLVCLSTVASTIASKCIANRLGKLLHLIISEEQGAYVPGREIMDQILITKELVHHINRKAHGGNLIVTLDMAKAFDKLKWSYLMDILKAFGFSPQFIRMLMRAKYWRDGEMKANIIDSPVWKRIFNIDESAIDTCSVSDDGMMHWKLDPSGSFTFKSAYEFCRAGSTPRASFNYLWESPQNPKISIFTWILFQHCIPSPENLQKLGFLMPSMCPFCQRKSYTAKHSLIDCHMIKGVWHHFSACVGILHQDSSSINQHFMNWWLRGNNNIYGFLRKHLPGIISWHIWKALNSLLYEDMNSFNPSKLIDSISRYTRNWLQMKLPKQLRVFDAWLIGTNLLPKFQSNPSIRLVKWLAPPKGRLKLNVDASFTHNPKQGAAILRDYQGRFVGAASFQVTGESPYQAEVDAAIKGITWALKFNKLLVFETDAKEITITTFGRLIPFEKEISLLTY